MRRIFTMIAVLALIAVITGCGVSHSGNAHMSYPYVAPAPVSNDPHPTTVIQPEPTVVFMGDSITYNWQNFTDAFKQRPTWTDAGVIGNDSGRMIQRFQAQVINAHPDVVVILAGTNDVYPGWALCAPGEGWYGTANNDTCANLQYMVRWAKGFGITPVLATIPPWGCPEPNCALAENADGSQSRYDRIAQLNAWIKQYGAAQGLVVVDYHSVLVSVDDKTYVPDLTVDGVHPSAAGYALMLPLIEDAITAAYQTKATQ